MTQNKENTGNAFSGATPYVGRSKVGQIRIASNPWLENATISALIAQRGLFKDFDVDVVSVLTQGVAGPFDTIAAGEADICMVSGYIHILPRIAEGAPVKIVGAGMRKAALAIFANPLNLKALHELSGHTIAVGPANGLLHLLMLKVLHSAGIESNLVKFKHIGSNEQCYRAVVDGDADACCASIIHLNNTNGLAVIEGGKIWDVLPKFTFQTAYASNTAIGNKYEGLVKVMAAYGTLYDYLMCPESQDAYFAARKSTSFPFNEASAQASWDFIQSQQPYTKDLTLTNEAISYLQTMRQPSAALAAQDKLSALTDMSAAIEASRLLSDLKL